MEIQATMKDGKLPAEDGSTPDRQDLVVPLLERCLKWCDIVQEKCVHQPFTDILRLTKSGKERLMKAFGTLMTS